MSPSLRTTTSITRDHARALWDSAHTFGRHSEKASKQGQMGVGDPRFATVANGNEPVVLTVAPLYANNPRFPSVETRAMVLDADAVLRANGGTWPKDAASLKSIIDNNPSCVVADVKAKNPPECFRIDGVKAGTRLVVVAGAEALNGERPAPSMVNVLNASQIPENLRTMVPSAGIRAGASHQTSVYGDRYERSEVDRELLEVMAKLTGTNMRRIALK